MSNEPRFVKPKGVSYTDMCIYIDKTFYTPERDDTLCFTYMYLLAYMLSCKAKYFNSYEDYDAYSCFLAQSTYHRMADKKKIPVKSVLNYMKSIMYFRKVAYLRDSFSEVIDPEYNTNWNNDLFVEKELNRLDSKNYYLLQLSIIDIIKGLPHEIKSNIPKAFKEDPKVYNKLYKSALISLIDQITLEPEDEQVLEDKKDITTFNETEFYNRHRNSDITCWRLPNDMSSVVNLIINKTKLNFIRDVKETTEEFKVDEEEMKALNFNLIYPTGEMDDEY